MSMMLGSGTNYIPPEPDTDDYLVITFNEFEGEFSRAFVKAASLREAVIEYEKRKSGDYEQQKEITSVINECNSEEQIINLYFNMDCPIEIINLSEELKNG